MLYPFSGIVKIETTDPVIRRHKRKWHFSGFIYRKDNTRYITIEGVQLIGIACWIAVIFFVWYWKSS